MLYAGFFVLNLLGAMATQILLTTFKTPSALVLAAIPIILSGWLFGRRFVWFSALLMYAGNGLYFQLNNMEEFNDPEGMAFGILSHVIFASTGFALCIVRDLYKKINRLNEEIKLKNLDLQAMVFKDPLTDLHNRRYVNEVIADQVSVFLRQISTPEFAMRNLGIEDKVLLLMIADVDDFKYINDTYGHVTGDLVLVDVSRRIRDAVRFDDSVVRWGGEEFLIYCPLMNRDSAELVMQKVLDRVGKTSVCLSDGTNVKVTISIGGIWIPPVRSSPYLVSFDKSIMIADQALYDAKTNGRCHGRLVVFREERFALHDNVLPEMSDELYRNSDCCEIRVVGVH